MENLMSHQITPLFMARNQEIYQFNRAENWKEKAIVRGKEGKVNKQMLGELRESCAKWRTKYEECQSRLRDSEERNKQLDLQLKKNG
jgi:Rps23 Pro-64 3,4-dihydroxylase Tpa1-like proline 4-hydroxylase